MNNIENAANHFGDKLVNTANTVADGIKDTTQSAVDAVKQNLHNQTLTDDASKYMHEGIDSIHEMSDQVKASAVKYADVCNRYVSEKPMKSVAIAVGLGALLAAVLLKKK